MWQTVQSGKATRGKDGAIWFAQIGRLGRLSLKGGSVKSYPVDINPDGSASLLWAIYWGTDNNVWWGDFYGKVGKLNPSTGAVTTYHLPESPVQDITSGPDGNMWAVAGSSVYRIVPSSGAYTKFAAGFEPSFIRKGPDGNMWYIQVFGNQIARMNTSGQIKNIWSLSGTPSAGCGPTCAALTAGPDGNIWFTQNEQLPQIGRITMSGQITYFPLQSAGAGDIMWGSDGAIWFNSPRDLKTGRITTSGSLQTYYQPVGSSTSFDALYCLSSSPDGNVYFTGWGGQKYTVGVGKIPLHIPQGLAGTYVHATHGSQFKGEVGTFYDFEIVSGSYFKGTINWGDGHITTAYFTRTQSGSPNYFRVSGIHTYASAGTYNVTINASEPGDQWKFSFKTQATVQ